MDLVLIMCLQYSTPLDLTQLFLSCPTPLDVTRLLLYLLPDTSSYILVRIIQPLICYHLTPVILLLGTDSCCTTRSRQS